MKKDLKSMPKVMMVGSAEHTGGGVTSVIKLIKKMPVWKKYSTYWLGTQTQGSKWERLYYAISSAIRAPFLVWKYDIIFSHNVPGTGLITQLPELIFAKLYRKKVILEIHVGNQLEHNKSNKLFIWWLGKADLILLLSKKWEEKFHEWYPNIKTPTKVLYNACDIIPEIDRSLKKKSIIMAAYLNDNKAPDLLIRAWSKIKHKHPEWSVTIMGNGEVSRFKQLASSLNCDDIEFPGYLTGSAKEKMWQEASIYCMCSYNEGFPMVVLEAWNYGINVITTPVGGLPDVIEEGKNCLTFPFGDYDKLAVQLELLMTNHQLRESMAKYARNLAIRKFSLNAINSDLDDIYNFVLNN